MRTVENQNKFASNLKSKASEHTVVDTVFNWFAEGT